MYFLLRRGQVLLFDDGLDLSLAGFLADDSPVATGVFQAGGEQRHRGFLREMEIAQLLDGLRSDERGIAGEHDDQIVRSQRFAGDHQGVSGAALLLLQHESYTGSGHRAADTVGFVSDDGENVAGRDHSGRGCDYVGQKRFSANLVQYLGMFRLQPGAFACGQDGDRGPGRRGGWLLVFGIRSNIPRELRAGQGYGGYRLGVGRTLLSDAFDLDSGSGLLWSG